MVRRVGLVSVLGALLVAGVSAHAGTLTSATWYQVVDGGFQTTQGVPMTRSFGQLGASGTSTASSIGVSLSYPAVSTTVFLPGYPSYDFAVQVQQGGAQVITATPGMGAGAPGVPGTVIVMTAVHTGMGVNQSMFVVGQTLVQIPLSHGKAGQFTNTFSVGGVAHKITVDFHAWTPGTLSFAGLTSLGQPLPNVTAMGSFNLTANGGGTVTLVSPSKVSIDGAVSYRRTASFTTLVLSFVPEPGALLLLAGAALVLGVRTRTHR
jgi:hypothetical protein